jgi:hypothetical protein
MDQTNNAAAIAALNDQCRQALGMRPGCRGVQTQGIACLPPETQLLIRQKVAAFNDFEPGDDPYCEHDFGAIDIDGVGKVYWKIDYHAADMEHGSEDPADPDQTVRVLNILLALEC